MTMKPSRRKVMVGIGGLLCFGGFYYLNSLRLSRNDQSTPGPSDHLPPLGYGNPIVRDNWILPGNFREILQ